MNNCVLIGRIANDLELKNAGETAVVNFALAIDRAGKKNVADFISCVAFAKTAENLCTYQGKGSQIAISGEIQVDKYVDAEGNNRQTTKVVARRIQFLSNNVKAEDSSSVAKNMTVVDDVDIPF